MAFSLHEPIFHKTRPSMDCRAEWSPERLMRCQKWSGVVLLFGLQNGEMLEENFPKINWVQFPCVLLESLRTQTKLSIPWNSWSWESLIRERKWCCRTALKINGEQLTPNGSFFKRHTSRSLSWFIQTNLRNWRSSGRIAIMKNAFRMSAWTAHEILAANPVNLVREMAQRQARHSEKSFLFLLTMR